jgi:hypothetical protein
MCKWEDNTMILATPFDGFNINDEHVWICISSISINIEWLVVITR